MVEEGNWLTIVDYSQEFNISISTIRRRIKSERIIYEMRDGRYYLWTGNNRPKTIDDQLVIKLKQEISLLKDRLRQEREEKTELQMLLSTIDKKLAKRKQQEHRA